MRISFFLTLALFQAVVLSADKSTTLKPLDPFVGHCWRGTFPDGKAVDTHCFEPVFGGKFVRDRHQVRGPEPDYDGETLYWVDARTQRIQYTYFTSQGGVSQGTVEPQGNRLHFPNESYQGPDGKMQTFRTVWERKDAEHYLAITEEEKAGKWIEAWRVEFSKVE